MAFRIFMRSAPRKTDTPFKLPKGESVPVFHGVFSIERPDMLEGDLPARAQRLIEDWACQHKDELLDMWRNQTFRQLPGLD